MMKKIISITLLLTAGTALANAANVVIPDDVWHADNIAINQQKTYDITLTDGTTLSGSNGFTLQLDISGWGTANGPLGWITTSGDSGGNTYGKSAGIFGYGSSSGTNNFCATTFTTNGSANSQGSTTAGQNRSDAKTWGGSTANQSDLSTTLFLTVQNGTATLYDLKNDGSCVMKVAQSNNMNTGDIAGLYVGNWNKNDVTQTAGTMNAKIYSSVLTEDQMNAIAVPEPSAFGLLAGLGALALVASRRRRSRK